ncbi:MAG: hypothetical protein ACLFP2_00135 [Candidatus Woesearchaeota archaeon]
MSKKKSNVKLKRKKNDNNIWIFTSAILGVLLLASIFTSGFGTCPTAGVIAEVDHMVGQANDTTLTQSWQTVKEGVMTMEKEPVESSGEQVSLQMYVMSQCPYGTQVVDAIAPVKEKLGDSLDLSIDYITYPTEMYPEKEDEFCVSGMCSMHGTSEVKGNIVQLCAMEHNPEKYLDMLTCMNENMNAIPDNWEACAEGLNVEEIRSCYEGDEGKMLLNNSAAKALNAEASGSPTIFLEGEKYSGERSEMDFMRSVCNSFEERPAACADVPEPTKVPMTIVNAEDCENCDSSQLIGVIKGLFPGVEVNEVEATSDEGKALIEQYNIEVAPSFLFETSLDETEAWGQRQDLARAFEKIDDKYKLRDDQTGATYFIDEEKRKEQEEMMENYPQQNLEVLGYDSEKPRLDYFVMAFCPYGNPADEAAAELHDAFGDKVEIVPHYILGVSGDSIESLHGEQEGDQGIRELCVLEEFGEEEYYEFTLAANEQCTSQNANSCWEDVAASVGLDTEPIKNCMEDKLTLAQEQADLNSQIVTLQQGQLVPPSASPTFLVNGAAYSGGRDAESLKAALCAEFENAPAVCDETLSQDTEAAGTC